ncbi:amidoligase family protein [Desulfocurvibacter africanus]|uniref:amidoligase family protein n=1 Tax=Desulfocurvibacter africanus TaxID=873 RepID=UPI000424C74E|nr:amidoligase family protein [Desulfocurvibacter africanus]
MPFAMPPRTHTHEGRERRVGVELEFAGLGFPEIIAAVREVYGGTAKSENRFLHKIEGTSHGTFGVELDSSIFKQERYLKLLDRIGIHLHELDTGDLVEGVLERVAATVIPYEVVTPPIPLSELDSVERLRDALRARGAEGTGESLLYAFGLHFNIELPDLERETILSLLKAYLLLEEWIAEESDIDLSRRVTPFIEEFPHDYRARVVDQNYQPDLSALMADYLEANPTRNRSLDLLPLLCQLNCELVRRYPVESHLIKPRPALHYRLPNCRLDDPEWNVADEWSHWVSVEKLAEDRDKLEAMGREYVSRPGFPRNLLTPDWPETVRRLLR